MNLLPLQRAATLSACGPQTQWLIQELWTEQAVGILGGEPKCFKSFLALDMAVSVASGAACLRRYPVNRTGSVLLFPAEDSLAIVRQRLEGISAAAGVSLGSLPIEVITAPSLRLDLPTDCQRLADTVESLKPVLLILDPFIRLHRVEENDASQIAPLLSFLRQLQRQFGVAVVLVHHARKDSGNARPGQALRGSSELHGWGDSNLYMRRHRDRLTLSTEHRAAVSQDHIPLQLHQEGPALALSTLDVSAAPQDAPTSPVERVRQILEQSQEPTSVQRLRQLCGLRMATVCEALTQLSLQGLVSRDSRGVQLHASAKNPPLSLSPPIVPPGNGNGKGSHQPLCSSGG